MVFNYKILTNDVGCAKLEEEALKITTGPADSEDWSDGVSSVAEQLAVHQKEMFWEFSNLPAGNKQHNYEANTSLASITDDYMVELHNDLGLGWDTIGVQVGSSTDEFTREFEPLCNVGYPEGNYIDVYDSQI